MRAHDESTAKADGPTPGRARPGTDATPVERLRALQRTVGNAGVAAAIQRRRDAVHDVLAGPGRPLAEPVRQDMEARLGADLSDVRLHTDVAAQHSAREIGARAYTSGSHVVLGPGGSDPHTLAHELTHVLQQRAGQVSGVDNGSGLLVSEPTDRFERAAEANAHRVMSGPPVQRAEPHRHATATAGETEPLVQRLVGFEFEAQWNVRRVVDEAAAEDKKRAVEADRDRTIRVALLRRMIDRRDVDPRVTEDERARGREGLTSDWLDGDVPTAAGEDKLLSQDLKPGTRQWDAAAMSLMYASVIAEPPLAGENPAKGEVLVEGDRFNLTADVSPTGGADLEWVTAPLAARDEVVHVLGDIVRMARYLNSRQSQRAIRVDETWGGGGEPRPNLVIYPNQGELLFQPQVTGGIRIDSLATLINFLHRPQRQRRGDTPAAPQIFTEGVDVLFDSMSRARRAVRANRDLRPHEPELVGLLGLIGSYLRSANRLPDGANPKSIAAGLLSRTDFAHNFGLLPDAARTYLREHPDVFVQLAMTSAELGMPDAGNRLYPNTIERGEVGDRTPVTLPLTRRNWLEGMLAGHDYLKNWNLLGEPARATGVANEADWQAVHPSLGALGSVEDQVPMSTPAITGFGSRMEETLRRLTGHGTKDPVTAAVFELRRMRGDRRVGDLTPLSLATFDLFELLNLGRRLRFRMR